MEIIVASFQKCGRSCDLGLGFSGFLWWLKHVLQLLAWLAIDFWKHVIRVQGMV